MSDVTIVKPEITGTEMPSQDAQPKKKKKKSKDEKIKALIHSANNWQAKYSRVRDELAQVQQELDEALAKLAGGSDAVPVQTGAGISLEEYNRVVRERDAAVAQVEALMQRLSQYYK